MKSKIRFLQIAAVSLLLALASCGGNKQQKESYQGGMPTEHGSMSTNTQKNTVQDMHKQHNSLANNFEHQDIVILDEVYSLSETTTQEMEQVIEAYLQIKDGLIKEDETAVNQAASQMAEKVAAVIPTKLEGKGLEAWQNHQSLYEQKLKEMQHIKGLDNKRSYFSHISEIVYCTIKSFGLKQGELYAIFCPMAFNNKGAYWINDSKTIQNPYLGSKMPTCGEIKEVL